MFNKKKALVDLMGGLGNQIYQLNFANYLKNKGYDVYINLDWFYSGIFTDGTTKRSLHLNPDDFSLKVIDKSTLTKFSQLDKLFQTKLMKGFKKSNINNVFSNHSGHTFNENKYFKYNKFSGYWQNLKYIEKQNTYILNGLMKNSLFHENLNKISKNTLVHLRKTDYIKLGEDLPDSYYEKAIKEIKKMKGQVRYDIFTDEHNPSVDSKLFTNAENVYSNNGDEPLSVMAKMMNYENYIIANSSFSLLPAFLSFKENSIVMYPEPWFKNSDMTSPTHNSWKKIIY
ncbi:MAG: hypothetical protein CBD44_01090 [Flavobacteriaceae bacterium TMED184]|nr:MAG: hypothetical protein CBD44_01090 [Flavobacteriaceae bacterium TMED184]|tara:strand:+ start:11045 stop:11899 length:855 start_codon:yes stop_codon:yes gene_type:complete